MKAILVFIFVFCLIVICHELGHFLFAKWSGVLVREFSIGMGPKLFSYRDKSGTLYTVRILPLGGYVRMADANDEDDTELIPGRAISVELNEHQEVIRINTSSKVQLTNSVPLEILAVDLEDALFVKGYLNGDETQEVTYPVIHDATIIEEDGTEVRIAPKDVQFQSAKLYQRMLTNFAGPLFNFILTFVLFIIMLFMQGGVYAPNNNAIIGSVEKDSPAAKAGLKADDKVLSIADQKITEFSEISKAIKDYGDQSIDMVIERDGKEKTLSVKPKLLTDSNGKEKIMLGVGQSSSLEKLSFFGVIAEAGRQTASTSMMMFNLLKDLIGGFSLDKLGGPVMIFQTSAQVANESFITILRFAAVLSVNLGIMNLLPIPMLDGGKLLFNIVEGIRRKPLNPEWEMRITLVGVGLLALLMILVTWNDIMRFLGR